MSLSSQTELPTWDDQLHELISSITILYCYDRQTLTKMGASHWMRWLRIHMYFIVLFSTMMKMNMMITMMNSGKLTLGKVFFFVYLNLLLVKIFVIKFYDHWLQDTQDARSYFNDNEWLFQVYENFDGLALGIQSCWGFVRWQHLLLVSIQIICEFSVADRILISFTLSHTWISWRIIESIPHCKIRMIYRILVRSPFIILLGLLTCVQRSSCSARV